MPAPPAALHALATLLLPPPLPPRREVVADPAEPPSIYATAATPSVEVALNIYYVNTTLSTEVDMNKLFELFSAEAGQLLEWFNVFGAAGERQGCAREGGSRDGREGRAPQTLRPPVRRAAQLGSPGK